MKLLDMAGVEVAAVPIDTTGAAVASDWFSMKFYQRCTFIIFQGAWAGGTPAVTLAQATAVAGTGTKALGFSKYYSMTGLTGTTYAETAVESNTFNLTATANTITVIDITGDMLDEANSFDCVQLNIASPGANADLICCVAILTEPRASAGLGVPNAKVD